MKILNTPHLCLEVELVYPTVLVLSRILSQKKALRACFLNTLTVFLVKDDKLYIQYDKVWGNHIKNRVCHLAAQTVHFCCMCVYMCVCVCFLDCVVGGGFPVIPFMLPQPTTE